MKTILFTVAGILFAGASLQAQNATFNGKVFLQGAYEPGTSLMRTAFMQQSVFPFQQPYGIAPWYYDGNESIAATQAGMVDWILVDLRTSPDTAIARMAAIVYADGSIRDANGDSLLRFNAPAGQYYLVIMHRSHLPVMTANKHSFQNSLSLDFRDTSLQVYGSCMIGLGAGNRGMIGGDVNQDRTLKYSGAGNDRSPILQRILSIVGGTAINATTTGYFAEDLRMDGTVKYSGSGNDPSLIIQNLTALTGSNAINSTFSGTVPHGVFLPTFACGDTLNDIRDGQQYPTVQIGTQCWMARNLNVGILVEDHYTASIHTHFSNDGITEKYCYNNDSSNCTVYGGLYDWNEMMNYSTTPGSQGICPTGWHIPTDAEWCTMSAYLDPTVNCNVAVWSSTNAGGKMKATGFDHWLPPNTGATNSSGFMVLGTGYRGTDGYFSLFKYNTSIWSSSEYLPDYGILIYLDYNSADVHLSNNFKPNGHSVRCLRDSIPPCTPQPGQANAGADSLNISGTSIILQANQPINGTGVWTIHSGTGGSFADSTIHNTLFTGQINSTYTLVWTISNACGSTSDTVIIGFTSSPVFLCGNTLNDIRDGQQYPTVQIGTQCWMAKNLNVGDKVNSVYTGSIHSDVSNNGIIERYCYNDDTANCALFGGLYEWTEMMNYTTTPGTQGICPTGWHIPTEAEWCTLTKYLDATVNCNTWGWSGTNAGGKMKTTGFTYWYTPNSGATNSSGFTAIGAGYRDSGGLFALFKTEAYFWSSSEYSSTGGIYQGLSYSTASTKHDASYKTSGFSVRCLRNN